MVRKQNLTEQSLWRIGRRGLPGRNVRGGVHGFEMKFCTIGKIPVVLGEDLVAFFLLLQIIVIGELEAAYNASIGSAQISASVITVCEGQWRAKRRANCDIWRCNERAWITDG